MNPQNTAESQEITETELNGSFIRRHIGPAAAERDAMLAGIGVSSLDALIDQTIPPDIRLRAAL